MVSRHSSRCLDWKLLATFEASVTWTLLNGKVDASIAPLCTFSKTLGNRYRRQIRSLTQTTWTSDFCTAKNSPV